LRSAECIALVAALVGCGAASPPISTAADVRTFACGTYTEVEPHVASHQGELATVPFVEMVLGDADPCSALPLIVVLHGLGDRPSVPRWPYRDLPVAVRVVMPQGPVPWGSGYAWSSVRVLDHEPGGLSATIDVQADRIASFLDALVAEREVRGPVILAGFSQGGILALSVLMRHPQNLGLVVPMSAWVPEAVRTAATPPAPPIRWLHGLDDERVPYDLALDAATDLRARGYDVELIGYAGQRHAMSMPMDQRLHSWLVQALANLDAGRPIATGFVLEP
jgi:phospholipase/carboxylesterase